ncbi:uncharacterized protein I303_102529 [Kwoniella dejecticola CBS 10117]|uniref:Uncharacterized protein n=1 Tax=Kwoniella dejecticola CBS 10117 TaxID=1296121 RepID=A0A1A6A8Z7_9TREE|nr:uncharacterized protein I303_02543 [Kwoniella dejecticola CBS 10117]OBR86535.1 hypothetical protein I303_02543 [Kwoniella dejecticola CBS 10117]
MDASARNSIFPPSRVMASVDYYEKKTQQMKRLEFTAGSLHDLNQVRCFAARDGSGMMANFRASNTANGESESQCEFLKPGDRWETDKDSLVVLSDPLQEPSFEEVELRRSPRNHPSSGINKYQLASSIKNKQIPLKTFYNPSITIYGTHAGQDNRQDTESTDLDPGASKYDSEKATPEQGQVWYEWGREPDL